MTRRKARRKRSTSEKMMIVLGILIALSMLFSLFVGLGSGGGSSNAPLPESERFEAPAEPLGAVEGELSPLAMAGLAATGPPAG